jgi:hypothetical protein
MQNPESPKGLQQFVVSESTGVQTHLSRVAVKVF